jgi:O-Antigen ligase/Tetratricopeptide repeat
MGYANAMAIASVIALLLGLGIATDASRRARAAAAVTLVPLASALALTGSRAAVATLLLGAGVGLGLAPDRARLLDAWRWIVPLPALAVLGVSVVDPTDSRIVGDAADQLGNRLLVFIALFTTLAVPPALIASRDRPRRVGHRPSRRLWAAAAVLGVVAVVAVGVARTPTLAGDRPIFWRVATAEFEQQPLLGSGAGTYAQVWLERRPVDSAVRDAHSIVIETASDLGIVGVLLVELLFAPPLLWALRARGQPLAPAAGGAFAAYAAHASVDWDWEMPAVTLAGLFCAVALGALADNDRRASRLGAEARGAALVLSGAVAAVALVGLAGASASEDASRSLARGDPARAEQAARRAERWQPWAAEPLLLQGQARVALDDPTEARALFARAAARDPNDYRTWLALAAVSRGEAAQIAVLRARALNPRAVRDISASTGSNQNSRFTKRRKEGA